MQEQEVKDYLKNHPEFFEQNAALLADIHLPSPHGSGTISLAERQQLAQRDKINALEERFAELVLNAQENDAIAHKLHVFDLKLHQANSINGVETLIKQALAADFALSDATLKLLPAAELDEQSATLSAFIASLKTPYCGIPNAFVDDTWFEETAASMAIIPLKLHEKVGFVALASQDKNHFFAEMGTDFLTKLGELVSAALSRYLEKTTP